ncbi:MAG: peptidase S16 [Alphaproteobacteria bacterium]|nr:MAG: peptidase S16 [Alphaproteobacteria bacterium]
MTDRAAEDSGIKVGSLPTVIPLFPLAGALLLPRTHLPLNIFEPRYLAMTRDALAGDRVIGMIQPRDPRGNEPEPALYETGCLGRIVEHQDTSDGRILITLAGLARFEIVEELARTTPYRKALVSYDRFAADGASGAVLPDRLRSRFEEVLRAFLAGRGLAADWNALKAAPDDRLIDAMAVICPLEAGEKQALLEAPDLTARCETMINLMEFWLRTQGGSPARPH